MKKPLYKMRVFFFFRRWNISKCYTLWNISLNARARFVRICLTVFEISVCLAGQQRSEELWRNGSWSAREGKFFWRFKLMSSQSCFWPQRSPDFTTYTLNGFRRKNHSIASSSETKFSLWGVFLTSLRTVMGSDVWRIFFLKTSSTLRPQWIILFCHPTPRRVNNNRYGSSSSGG